MEELIKKLEKEYRKPISEIDEFDWAVISIVEDLSEDFIREYQHKVNWENIFKYQKLSKDFIIEFRERKKECQREYQRQYRLKKKLEKEYQIPFFSV